MNRSRRPFVLVVVGTLLLAAARQGEAASRAEAVTLALREFKNANFVRVVVFSGVVSSPEAGQEVEIVGEDCGTRGLRLIAATKTTPGGAFQAENPGQSPPYAYTPISSGITFRARWRGNLSAPVQYRQPATPLSAVKAGPATWKVHFAPQQLPVPYAGKLIELQRLSNGRWVRLQGARLKLKPSLRYGAFNHEAAFTVAKRGLRLRGYLPARSAAPCWLSNATEPWRS